LAGVACFASTRVSYILQRTPHGHCSCRLRLQTELSSVSLKPKASRPIMKLGGKKFIHVCTRVFDDGRHFFSKSCVHAIQFKLKIPTTRLKTELS